MAYLTALLPMTTAVACYAALRRHADTTVATADPDRPGEVEQPRSRGQVMADEFAARLTYGAIAGHDTHGTPIRRSPSSSAERPAAELSIEIAVLMSDETLLQGGDEPAELVGYGPIPAGVARDLVTSGHSKLRDKLRRLYTAPGSRQLTAMEARARLFPDSCAGSSATAIGPAAPRGAAPPSCTSTTVTPPPTADPPPRPTAKDCASPAT